MGVLVTGARVGLKVGAVGIAVGRAVGDADGRGGGTHTKRMVDSDPLKQEPKVVDLVLLMFSAHMSSLKRCGM